MNHFWSNAARVVVFGHLEDDLGCVKHLERKGIPFGHERARKAVRYRRQP